MADKETPTADASAQDASKGDASAKKGGKFMPLIFCAVVVVLGAGGAMGMRMVMGGGQSQPSPDDQAGAKAPPIVVPEIDDGQYSYYEFPSTVVNANVPRRDRYIRATLTLALPTSVFDKVSKQIEIKKPELQSWLTVYLSGLTLEEIGGRDNLDRIRGEIRDRLNEQLWPNAKGLVHHVLFKEFAVQ